jgi:uncharacterized protein YjbI with pentapeptide repeats
MFCWVTDPLTIVDAPSACCTDDIGADAADADAAGTDAADADATGANAADADATGANATDAGATGANDDEGTACFSSILVSFEICAAIVAICR